MKDNQTFISLCIDGLADSSDISMYIDMWKRSDSIVSDRTLIEFLGISSDELNEYINDPSSIHDIVWAYRIKRMHIH